MPPNLMDLFKDELAHLEFLHRDACNKGHFNEASRLEQKLHDLKIRIRDAAAKAIVEARK